VSLVALTLAVLNQHTKKAARALMNPKARRAYDAPPSLTRIAAPDMARQAYQLQSLPAKPCQSRAILRSLRAGFDDEHGWRAGVGRTQRALLLWLKMHAPAERMPAAHLRDEIGIDQALGVLYAFAMQQTGVDTPVDVGYSLDKGAALMLATALSGVKMFAQAPTSSERMVFERILLRAPSRAKDVSYYEPPPLETQLIDRVYGVLLREAVRLRHGQAEVDYPHPLHILLQKTATTADFDRALLDELPTALLSLVHAAIVQTPSSTDDGGIVDIPHMMLLELPRSGSGSLWRLLSAFQIVAYAMHEQRMCDP
jgi:hypothetical protein